jgi:glycosyltransferase involved in cell wall biosynthesis
MSGRPHILLYGTVFRPCGFSLINRRLVAELRRLGYRVSARANDAEPGWTAPQERPDVYLFHGDPFDFDKAPGRLNAFFLPWEYRRIEREWVDHLNGRFDLVIVPSQFSKRVCEESGVEVPVRVCRGGVDRGQFHPSVAPRELPTGRRFRFIYLGGAHERRGTDVLLAAYTEEFSADDDVALIVKGFHYEHHRPWVERMMEEAGVGRPGAPEVVYVHQTEPSVAGYFAAADVGVFPLRAECLGLPVLECIASGRPVIVTAGTGLDEFCSPANARFVRASERVDREKWYLEPDRGHLRELMRAAYERGRLAPAERVRISASVASFTWEYSVSRLAETLEEGLVAKAALP